MPLVNVGALAIYEWSPDDAYLNQVLQWVMGRCQRLIRMRQERSLLPTGRDPRPVDHVFPDEVDDLLSGRPVERESDTSPPFEPGEPTSRLYTLKSRLGLSDDEFDLLVMAIAPDIAPEVARLYAFIQGASTRYALSLALAADLLDRGLWDASSQSRLLEPPSRLIHYDLVRRLDDGHLESQCSVVPNPEVYAALQGHRSLPRNLSGFAELAPSIVGSNEAPVQLLLSDAQSERIERIAGALAAANGAPPTVIIHGPSGTGKKTIAAELASRQGHDLLVVDADRFPSGPAAAATLRALRREALLRDAWICLRSTTLFRDQRESFDELVHQLDPHPAPYFINLMVSARPSLSAGRPRLLMRTELPRGDSAVALWSRALARFELAGDLDLDLLAHQYPLASGDMQAVARIVAAEEQIHREKTVSFARVVKAIHERTETRLSTLATRLDLVYSIEQLVAPESVISELQTMISRGRHSRLIFERWGFGRNERKRRGFSALFSGKSGTGKTMAAMIVARELELELYRVDLAQVVSKYIGETEKNLEKIFAEAERANIVILFDEADSLFSKRTRVKSSHDRYANMEVNYLLQRLDEFEGVAILTSNFGVDMDDALARRLDYRVDFPFPKSEHRAILWQALLPNEADRAPDIDFRQLADAFEIAGGHIRNALLRAAFMAAAEEGPISHDLLLEAGYLEMRSMGHLVAEAEFIRERTKVKN